MAERDERRARGAQAPRLERTLAKQTIANTKWIEPSEAKRSSTTVSLPEFNRSTRSETTTHVTIEHRSPTTDRRHRSPSPSPPATNCSPEPPPPTQTATAIAVQCSETRASDELAARTHRAWSEANDCRREANRTERSETIIFDSLSARIPSPIRTDPIAAATPRPFTARREPPARTAPPNRHRHRDRHRHQCSKTRASGPNPIGAKRSTPAVSLPESNRHTNGPTTFVSRQNEPFPPIPSSRMSELSGRCFLREAETDPLLLRALWSLCLCVDLTERN